MKQITVAVAGCGGRGLNTYSSYAERFADRMKIVAAADPRTERLQMMQEQHGVPKDACYENAEKMLEKGRIADVLFLCTPDALHYSQAVKALKLGYHILLEKPIAGTAEQCRDIERLALENHCSVAVCHVLRYTVFYQKLKELVDSGVIGAPVSVQAIEKVCYWHQAHSFVRGNWRNSDESSPMILQKCCHDMDILLWLVGKHCERVSSFGSLSLFREDKAPAGAPERCTDGCPAANTCPFNAIRFYYNRVCEGNKEWPVDVVCNYPTPEGIMEALKTGPYGRCVYHCDNNVVDHQVVNMELEDGVTINFTMCAFTAEGGREIRIMGTDGEIFGDMDKNIIDVKPFVGAHEQIDVTKLTDDFSGHGGGDARLMEDFLKLVAGEPVNSVSLTSISRSIESHLVAFAAEESRLNDGKVIEILH